MRIALQSTLFLVGVCFCQAAYASCDRLEALEAYKTTQSPPVGAKCAIYLGQSARSGVSCHWEYAFRDPSATRFAAEIEAAVQQCRRGQLRGPDVLVNHPDSYDLREWETVTGIYSVSIKDKGGLNKTLVFLRFESK